jgi:hypothetical protein
MGEEIVCVYDRGREEDMNGVCEIIGAFIKDHLVAHFGEQNAVDDELMRDGTLDMGWP